MPDKLSIFPSSRVIRLDLQGPAGAHGILSPEQVKAWIPDALKSEKDIEEADIMQERGYYYKGIREGYNFDSGNSLQLSVGTTVVSLETRLDDEYFNEIEEELRGSLSFWKGWWYTCFTEYCKDGDVEEQEWVRTQVKEQG